MSEAPWSAEACLSFVDVRLGAHQNVIRWNFGVRQATRPKAKASLTTPRRLISYSSFDAYAVEGNPAYPVKNK